MLFGRRNKQPLWSKILTWLWPRKGFRRAALYIWHRVARLPGTEHSIAAGFASGAAVSFTPFLGLHFLMGFALAWIVRGNLLASAIGTAIGNPWTFPLIFALTGNIGSAILGYDVTAAVPVWSWDALFDAPLEYLASFFPLAFPLLVGGAPLGAAVWVIVYFVFKKMLASNRKRRQARKNKIS